MIKKNAINFVLFSLIIIILPILFLQTTFACDYNISNCKNSSWEANKIYCLNTSINATRDCMILDNNSITLDCRGYNITGPGTDYGIESFYYDNTTIRNCNVKNFVTGIFLHGSNGTIQNCTASFNNRTGIEITAKHSRIDRCTANHNYFGIIVGSNYTNITNSEASFNTYYGLYLDKTHILIENITTNSNTKYGIYAIGSQAYDITIQNSTSQENGIQDFLYWPFFVGASAQPYQCTYSLINVNGSGGKPIGFYNSSISLSNQEFSMLELCYANNSNLNNVTIRGSSTLQNNNLFVYKSDYSNFTKITIDSTYSGIELYNTSYALIKSSNIGNVSNNGENAIHILEGSNNNTIRDNTFRYNTYGISIDDGEGTNIINNTLYNGTYGVSIGEYRSSLKTDDISIINNTIYNTDYGIAPTFSDTLLIEGNKIFSSNVGLYHRWSANTTIINNNFSSNNYGGIIVDGQDTLFENNIISSNTNSGMGVLGGDNITVNNNNFSNNSKPDLSFSGNNSFNSNHLREYDLNFTIEDYNGKFNISSVNNVPAIPSYYKNISKFINITTNQTGNWIHITLSYNDSGISAANESKISMYEYNGTEWINLSNTFLDTTNNIVSVNITSFSIFAPMWNTITCGNNITEPGETCDGSDLNGATCVGQGFDGGTLSCLNNCLGYNTSECTFSSSSGSGSSKKNLVVSHKIICPDNNVEFTVLYHDSGVEDVKITLNNLTELTNLSGKATFQINKNGTYDVEFYKLGYRYNKEYYLYFELCEEEKAIDTIFYNNKSSTNNDESNGFKNLSEEEDNGLLNTPSEENKTIPLTNDSIKPRLFWIYIFFLFVLLFVLFLFFIKNKKKKESNNKG